MSQGRRTQPMPPRWEQTRRRILKRDGHICYICGQPGAGSVDHIVPVSLGGGEEDSNLASVHEYPCHASKTAREARMLNPMAVSRKRSEEEHPGLVRRDLGVGDDPS